LDHSVHAIYSTQSILIHFHPFTSSISWNLFPFIRMLDKQNRFVHVPTNNSNRLIMEPNKGSNIGCSTPTRTEPNMVTVVGQCPSRVLFMKISWCTDIVSSSRAKENQPPCIGPTDRGW
jgi:hypothetical protein